MEKLNSECWYYKVCQMDNSCDSCLRFIEMDYLMSHSGLPKSKQKPIPLIPERCDYDAFNELDNIKSNIVEFTENGDNLFIGGAVGNGKTTWAIKILLKYFNEIWAGNGLRVRGVFVHVPTLLIKLKDFDNPMSQEYKDILLNADLIVWDEIGGVGMSNYDYSQLLVYIDQRVLNEKANIYTCNLVNARECEKYLGTRLTSRVWTNSKKVILTGRDKRGSGL